MQRLAQFDVTSRYSRDLPRLLVQTLFGLACAGTFLIARMMVDEAAPGAGPFALIFPPILLATLFGHWRAGVVTFAVTFLWTWYAILPPPMSFRIDNLETGARIVLNGLSAVLVIFFAEAFRSAVRTAAEERDLQIERSEMLRLELEHRSKNNFQLMLSLIELQRRQETDGMAVKALELASRRLRSFTSAYSRLPIAESVGAKVPMRPYLSDLVVNVADAVFRQEVVVNCDIADIELPRETASALGLYTNEALTNCAKHADFETESGVVAVTLRGDAIAWSLTITDNGKPTREPKHSDGHGAGLLLAFAKQAGAVHRIYMNGIGCTVRLESKKTGDANLLEATL